VESKVLQGSVVDQLETTFETRDDNALENALRAAHRFGVLGNASLVLTRLCEAR
jgi:hypothetical protein